MSESLVCRDIHVRHTGADGASFVQLHRVWDAERFMTARRADAERANADASADSPRLAKAEQITPDQYRKERQ